MIIFMGLRPCLVVTPSPVSPSPLGLGKGKGKNLERGAAPLLDTPLGGEGKGRGDY